jgi:predicted ATPase
MFLERMRLRNFGAFRDTEWLSFSKGVNLIAGQNNTGKSSLIKSLDRHLRDMRHVSLDSYRPEDLIPPIQDLELVVSGHEVRRALFQRNSSVYWPLNYTPTDVSPEAIERDILGQHEYRMRFIRGPNGSNSRADEGPTHSGFPGPATHFIELIPQPATVRAGSYGGGQNDNVLDIMQLFLDQIFIFDAERIGIGQCAQNETPRMNSRATDLPAYLHLMRGRKPKLFDRFVEHVREVIPTVYSVTTTSVNQSETRILVWPTEHMDNEQFCFPLNDSGTGVGQVMAILAAAMTSDPTIFIIDEINSYLHPAAVKSLLRILQNNYDFHQYIITTHSPEVISGGNASTVYLVKRTGMDSTVSPVNMEDIAHLREMSDQIGISVSDIFAADNVLWVEGRTEELCFSAMRSIFDIDFPSNTIVSSVVSTGDFFSHKKRDTSLIFQIYDHLSRVTLPIVKSVTFSFDREDFTDSDMEDVSRRAKGRVAFLPRRHIECYLLCPTAISAFLNEFDVNRPSDYSPQDIADMVGKIGGDKKYHASGYWSGAIGDEKWLEEVDAANIIYDVVSELTDKRVRFNKTDNSAWLLKHIANNKSESIIGLLKYLRELASLVRSPSL